MTKNKINHSIQKLLWDKIRYYQHLNDISNDELSELMMVHPKTLLSYDKKADNITLAQINHFVKYNFYDITFANLIKDIITYNDFVNS